MNSEIQIEQIRSIERLVQCSAIMIDAYTGSPWHDAWTPDTANALLTFCYRTPGFKGWIASSNNAIVGCCIGNIEPYYTGEIFVLRELFVSVAAQNKAVGTRLLDVMKNDLETIGVKTTVLFTKSALADFYSRAGFAEVKAMSMMAYTTAR